MVDWNSGMDYWNSGMEWNGTRMRTTARCARGNLSRSICQPIDLPYSVRRRLTNLQFREFFVFTLSSFSSVFMDCYCIYGLSVSR